METVLYYDCFSGISGDMHLGAMLDAGIGHKYLSDELNKLGMEEYELDIQTVQKRGISATKVNIKDLSHHTHHSHGSRNFYDISDLIENSGLSTAVKELSIKIFTKLAHAEAKIHGTTIDKIHFHEVGAVDSIIDIVGSAICLNKLDPGRIISSPVQVGGGFVHCAHGILPVPAPATAELLKGVPIKRGLVEKETTTPTGAAILSTVVDEFTETIGFTPTAIGYGAGSREYEFPNVLRVLLGSIGLQTGSVYDIDNETLIACNIDDMNPELYEPLFEELFEKGAKDVYLTPIIMKKSRPAVTLHVLCTTEIKDALLDVIFMQSSTFGVRMYPVTKQMLKRRVIPVHTEFGTIHMKQGLRGETVIKQKPEYEECKKAAENHHVPIKEVYRAVSDSIKDG